MSERFHQALSWSALMLVLVVPLLMLILMAMPMEHGMGGCPFMQGETSLCAMTVFDHIDSWQHTFTTTLIEILSFAVPVLTLVWWCGVLLIPERPSGYRRRTYPVPPFLQELFSSGILNPRIP